MCVFSQCKPSSLSFLLLHTTPPTHTHPVNSLCLIYHTHSVCIRFTSLPPPVHTPLLFTPQISPGCSHLSANRHVFCLSPSPFKAQKRALEPLNTDSLCSREQLPLQTIRGKTPSLHPCGGGCHLCLSLLIPTKKLMILLSTPRCVSVGGMCMTV